MDRHENSLMRTAYKKVQHKIHIILSSYKLRAKKYNMDKNSINVEKTINVIKSLQYAMTIIMASGFKVEKKTLLELKTIYFLHLNLFNNGKDFQKKNEEAYDLALEYFNGTNPGIISENFLYSYPIPYLKLKEEVGV